MTDEQQRALLALLDGGEQSTSALAGIFGMSVPLMTSWMVELAAAGLVKRQASSGRWARLVSRPPAVAPLDAVFEQVRYMPKALSVIVAGVGQPRAAVLRALEQLVATGRVRRVGRGSGERFAAARPR